MKPKNLILIFVFAALVIGAFALAPAVSAKNFIIQNESNSNQNYFVVNGTNGDVFALNNISAAYFKGSGKYLTNINTSAINSSGVNYWTKSGSMLYYTGGNVGIGTSSPGSLLTIGGGVGGSVNIGAVGAGVTFLTASDGNPGSTIFSVSRQNGNIIQFQPFAGGGFNFAGGNVGIGTIVPVNNLTINGNIGVAGGFTPNFASLAPNILYSRTNLMVQSTYSGTNFNGWNVQTPSYLTESITSPSNAGFSGSVLQWNVSGGAQGQRDWADAGAQTTAFILGHTYRITFKYRSNGPFDLHDRDSEIVNVPANPGNAKFFTYDYTKTSNSWTSPYLLVYFGNSATVSWVQMSELSVEDISSPTYSPAIFSDSSGNVGIGTTSPSWPLTVASSTSNFLITAKNSGSNAAVIGANNNVSSTYLGTEGSIAGGTIHGTSPYASFVANQGLYPLQFGTNNSIRMTVSSSGYVGIGTSNPTKTLQVMGPIGLNDNSWFGGGYQSGYTSFYTSSNGAQGIQAGALYVSGSYSGAAPTNGAYIQGSVGIGTTAVNDKLNINGGIDFSSVNGEVDLTHFPTGSPYGPLVIRDKNGPTVNTPGVKIQTGNASGAYVDRLVINTDTNTPYILLNPSGGNVGIHTTSPSYPLDVNGTVRATAFIGDGSQLTGVNATNANELGGHPASFYMPLNKSVYGQFDFNGGWTNNGLSIINGNIYAQQGYFYKINSLSVSTLTVNGSIIPPSGFDNQFDIGSSSLRWRNLYLGTNAIVSGAEAIGYTSPGTASLAVNGNVGIGTNSPSGKLEVNMTGTIIPALGTVGTGFNLLRADGHTGLSVGYLGSNGDIWMQNQRTDSAVAYNIDLQPNGGSVGIGTTSPSSKLQVVDTAAAQGASIFTIGDVGSATRWQFRADAGSGAEEYINSGVAKITSAGTLTLTSNGDMVLTGGNVGINQTSPVYNLDVGSTTGTVNIRGTSGQLYVNNIAPNSGSTVSIDNSNSLSVSGNIIPSMQSNSGGGSWSFGSAAWGGNGPAVSNINSVTGLIYSGSSGSQLYTLSSNPGQASLQLDGSVFIGDGASPYNPLGITGSSDGYLLVDNGGSFGGNLYVNNAIQVHGASGNMPLNTQDNNPSGTGINIVNTNVTNSNWLMLVEGSGNPKPGAFGIYNQGAGTTGFGLQIDQSLNAYFPGTIYSGGNAVLTTASGYVSGSGTANYVPLWNGANSITNSNIYQSGSNVGIGTTSPIHRLEVYTNVAGIASGTHEYNQFAVGNSTTGGIYLYGGADQNGYAYLGAVRSHQTYVPLILNPDGSNVGIGTVTPAGTLEVDNTAGYNLVLNKTSGAAIEMIRSNSPYQSWQITTDPNFRIYDNTHSATRFTIDTSGNVGIGTSGPSQKLEVSGGYGLFDSGIYVGSTNTQLTQGSGNSLQVTTDSGYVQIGPQNTGWAHFQTGNPAFYFNKGITADNGGGSYSFSSYSTQNLALATGGTTRMTILNSNGYVGIGTTNPGATLDVVGNISVYGSSEYNWFVGTDTNGAGGVDNNWGFGVQHPGSNYFTYARFYGTFDNTRGFEVVNKNGNSVPFFVGGSGNVGIGTTSPLTNVDIQTADETTAPAGNNWPGLLLHTTGGAVHSGPTLMFNGGNGLTYAIKTGLDNGPMGHLIFYRQTNSTYNNPTPLSPVMILDDLGHVGIGTTSPGAMLDVSYTGNYGIRSLESGTPTATNYGGYFASNSGSSSYDSYGVYASASAPNGGNAYGVYGSGSIGVYGSGTTGVYASGSSTGVYSSGSIVGTSTITAANYVESTLSANNALYAPNGGVYAGGSGYSNYFAGNVGIGTTDNTGGLIWQRGTPTLAVSGNGIWSNYGAVFTGDIATYPTTGGALRVGWVSNTKGLVQALMNGGDTNLQLEGSPVTVVGGLSISSLGSYGQGTTTHTEQRGQVTVGTSSANEKSISFTFPNSFVSTTPYILVTADSTSTASDAFATSAYNINTTGFSVHVVRVDGGGPGWGQSLRLDYIAWN